MIRVVFFLIVLAALALGAAWVADRPGDIVVTWLGYHIETSVTVAALALIVVVLVLMFVIWLLRAHVTFAGAGLDVLPSPAHDARLSTR